MHLSRKLECDVASPVRTLLKVELNCRCRVSRLVTRYQRDKRYTHSRCCRRSVYCSRQYLIKVQRHRDFHRKCQRNTAHNQSQNMATNSQPEIRYFMVYMRNIQASFTAEWRDIHILSRCAGGGTEERWSWRSLMALPDMERRAGKPRLPLLWNTIWLQWYARLQTSFNVAQQHERAEATKDASISIVTTGSDDLQKS